MNEERGILALIMNNFDISGVVIPGTSFSIITTIGGLNTVYLRCDKTFLSGDIILQFIKNPPVINYYIYIYIYDIDLSWNCISVACRCLYQ